MQPPSTAPADVPCARGTLLAGAVASAAKLWGDDGLAALRERLDADARRALLDDIILPVSWYPETYFEACNEIVWSALARGDDEAFDAYVRGSIDHLWSRLHRVIMGLTTPPRLARRAPDMWRHDHTHGSLEVELRESEGTVRVRGYPYARTGIMGRGQTEALRYILSHARVKTVRATHELDDQGNFTAILAWE
ncbi:MAG: hypothetical protein ACLQVI_39055 [Polyangiaceae bacterium]